MGTRHLYWILTGPSFAVCISVLFLPGAALEASASPMGDDGHAVPGADLIKCHH
jgi:hypothetical protein